VTAGSPAGGFRITGSKHLADAGFLSIDELTIEAPDGEEARRVIVRHSGAVVVVPVLADRATAVLVRQFRAATGGELLEAPAGKRDVEGEQPATTAAREMQEEVGYASSRLVKIGEFYNAPGSSDEYTHVYVALDAVERGGPEPASAEEKYMVIEQVALADTETLVSQRRLVDAKSIIGLLLARAYLAGEHAGLDPS
jgi:8-oxo-dGTP pyrophosphatase MutT (NUDIX family)